MLTEENINTINNIISCSRNKQSIVSNVGKFITNEVNPYDYAITFGDKGIAVCLKEHKNSEFMQIPFPIIV